MDLILMGLSISGFPDMFNMVGAGSPSVLATMDLPAPSNTVTGLELFEYMRANS